MTPMEQQWVRDMMHAFPSPEQAKLQGDLILSHERILMGTLKTGTNELVPGVLSSMSEMKEEQKKTNGTLNRLQYATIIIGCIVIAGNSATTWAPILKLIFTGGH